MHAGEVEGRIDADDKNARHGASLRILLYVAVDSGARQPPQHCCVRESNLQQAGRRLSMQDATIVAEQQALQCVMKEAPLELTTDAYLP